MVELFFGLNYIHFVLDNRGEESYNTSTGEMVTEYSFLCLCVSKFDLCRARILTTYFVIDRSKPAGGHI